MRKVSIPKTETLILWFHFDILPLMFQFSHQGIDPIGPRHRLHTSQVHNHHVLHLFHGPTNLIDQWGTVNHKSGLREIWRRGSPWRRMHHVCLTTWKLLKQVPFGLLWNTCWESHICRMWTLLFRCPIRTFLAPMSQLVTQKARLGLLLLLNPSLCSWISSAALSRTLLKILPHLLDLPHSLTGLVLLGVDLHHLIGLEKDVIPSSSSSSMLSSPKAAASSPSEFLGCNSWLVWMTLQRWWNSKS